MVQKRIVKDKSQKGSCMDCGKSIQKKSKRCTSCSKVGENSNLWKGNEVGLNGLHLWVQRHKPKPALCECCNQVPPYDLANISQEYHRDVNDFEWLCRKCHMRKDHRAELVKQNLIQTKFICMLCNKEINKKGHYLRMITHNQEKELDIVYFHLPTCWSNYNNQRVNQRFAETLNQGMKMIHNMTLE